MNLMPSVGMSYEVKVPDTLQDQLAGYKLGDEIKLRGTYKVKERGESDVTIDISNLFVETRKKHA